MNKSPPDVEAKITFLKNGVRTRPVFTGYRPNHLVTDNYLTTGAHHYYERDKVEMGETVLGTITFISPEAYPNTLWIGKIINIQEGPRIVGHAEITMVFNLQLLNLRKEACILLVKAGSAGFFSFCLGQAR
jgi:translation elongation factor EF-Tu-like GTPase